MSNRTSRRAEKMGRQIAKLGDLDRSVAFRARKCLLRYYGVEALDLLRQASQGSEPLQRRTVAMTLGDIHAPGSFEALAPMLRDEDEVVRYDAGVALGNLGDPRAAVLLEELIFEEFLVTSAAFGACQGLRALGDAALDSYQRIVSSGNTALARGIPSALSYIGTPRCVSFLQSLTTHPSPEVRQAAQDEMAELAHHSS